MVITLNQCMGAALPYISCYSWPKIISEIKAFLCFPITVATYSQTYSSNSFIDPSLGTRFPYPLGWESGSETIP